MSETPLTQAKGFVAEAQARVDQQELLVVTMALQQVRGEVLGTAERLLHKYRQALELAEHHLNREWKGSSSLLQPARRAE